MTLKELSRELGLSVTTVSDALKDPPAGYVAPKTRERVQQAAARLGYRPNVNARRLVTQRATNMVGVFLHDMPHYQLQLTKLNIVQRMLAKYGYEQNLAIGGEETFARLARQNPSGLIVFNWGDLSGELEPYLHTDTHVVVLDNETPTLPRADRVHFDRAGSTGLAVRHLLELRHRRLGLFLPADHWPHGERGRGVHTALAEYGLTADAITAYATDRGANFETGDRVAEEWLADGNRPTGLVVLNDETAASFLTRVRAAGVRVPEDVSIVGQDDRPWSPHLSVPLTTVTHPAEEIGRAAVELLRQRLAREYAGPPRKTIIGSELVVRASTAAPGGA